MPVLVYSSSTERPKPIRWVGSSREDLRSLPPLVKRAFGFALRAAQNGAKHPDAKPLHGFGGAGVLEVVEDYAGDTYRAVYTVTLGSAVYVLHVFQKKSKHGIGTPQHVMDLIRARLQAARRMHEGR